MARAANPNYNASWRPTKDSLTPVQLLDLSDEIVGMGFLPNIAHDVANVTAWPENAVGSRSEVRKDLAEMLGHTFQAVVVDIRGPGNKPRILFQANIGAQTLTLQVIGAEQPIVQRVVEATRKRFPAEAETERIETASHEPRPKARPIAGRYSAGNVIDSYKLEQRLGRGHSGEVWKATVGSFGRGRSSGLRSVQHGLA